MVNRTELADLILARLESDSQEIIEMYSRTKGAIGHFHVDDLLPAELARQIYNAFPPAQEMKLKKTLREYKYIAVQMDNYNPILEEAVYAFQDPRIVEVIREVCGLKSIYPDEHLYAGGLSMMGNRQFLNPHVDNSHDKSREKWRVLNLLYYVTEDWREDAGGNLELWPEGVDSDQVTIHSRFNRLVVMATHDLSWHSVSPISSDRFRCCVSNYYFSDEPLNPGDHFHVTSFRGRPEQRIVDPLLRADAAIRSGVRKVLKHGVANKTHVYRKPADK